MESTFTVPERIVDCLHIAFHHTIQRAPFLAGSIVPFPPEEGGRPWLRNLIPQGAARLHIKDLSNRLRFDDLERHGFAQHLLKAEELCPLPEVAYVSDDPVDVCQMQANFVAGGLLFVVSIIHIAADGRGVTEVIKIFSDAFRKAQAAEIGRPLKERDDVYRSDRTLLVSGHGVPGAIENHAAWTSSPVNTHSQIVNVESACRTFRISARALSDAKRAVSASLQNPEDWISTNDVISALIWRSIMVARHRAGLLADGATTHVAQPLDCRSHLGLPEPYFGNVLYMTRTSLPLAVLQDGNQGLAAAARALRVEINAMTADKFTDLVGYAERTEQQSHTRLNILEELPTGGIILTSHFKFALHELDFGPLLGGHMKALRLPARGTMAGAVIVMPRLPDGSCEFMITEQKSTIACLLEDDLFCRLTGEETVIPAAAADGMVEETVSGPEDELGVGRRPPPGMKRTDGQVEDMISPALLLPQSRDTIHAPPPAVLPTLDFCPAGNTKKLSTLLVTEMNAPHVGSIRIIQLNRPRSKNAISRQMLQELSEEVEGLHTERTAVGGGGARALVLASAVDGIFCAGADLVERRSMTAAETHDFLGRLRMLFARLAALPVPSIACVSGPALGGGFELALCCHLRVFASNAVVGLPETRLGIIPGAGGTYRLPRIVGLPRALDMVLTGRRMAAHEAAAMGLCNRLVTSAVDTDLALAAQAERAIALSTGIALAEEIAKGGPVAVRAAVAALACSCEAVENAAYESVLGTKDRSEGLLAFGEKREPVFIGE
ncbi:hypothetical protein NEMBOFW57_009360 [Staphylotrichum longicolle]|uniref:Trichothecene 3-O-acetyltransferase-like N-terminal domain-containing protein n=1 Tax=Staphylotrichum longicolle TaxID=669026 RepID=A0AAD4HTD5_9PEZI|nr:hypothetical protein NEMBOFW57_009360 [Staphylotrichum longicolle]